MTATFHKLLSAAVLICLLTALALLAVHGAAFSAVLKGRVMLCLQTLIPSLFGCMALCNLLTGSGAAAWLGAKMQPLAKRMHLPPEVLTVFLISQIAGYPVGTLMLRKMAECGRIRADAAAQLSYLCFGGGPAFLVGLAGAQLFGSAAAGWMMLGACVCANAVLLLLFRPRDLEFTDAAAPVSVHLTATAITEAVSAAMRSLAGICGMVLLFGVLMQLCDLLGLTALPVRLGSLAGISPQTVRALLAAAADITQLEALFSCGLPFRMLLAVSAALLSFGGICVHWQCLALGGDQLRAGKLLLLRLLASVFTFFLVYFAAEMIPFPESISVFAPHAAISKSGSVMPSLLIFCTGFPFLIKKD